GGARERGRGARDPHPARRHRLGPAHARRHPEEDLRVENRVLGRAGVRLALRPDVTRDEPRHRDDRGRQAGALLGGSMRPAACIVGTLLFVPAARAQQPPQPAFTFQELMIPMRDGVRLQPVILTPTDKSGPLPISFRRTPYGVPDGPVAPDTTSLDTIAHNVSHLFIPHNSD